MTLGRPVNARAALSAPITASVPELQNLMSSKLSTRSHSSEASSISMSHASANAVPRAICALTASAMAGLACPMMSDVKLLLQSR